MRLAILLTFAAFASCACAAAEQKELRNSIGMRLARIEAGSFLMGQAGPPADYRVTRHPAKFDDADWDERPVHRVTMSRFFHLGATEVTLGEYRRFRPGHQPSRKKDDEAVTGVSWFDAVEFCKWLSAREGRNYRLPTEAEWEYACRAGAQTLFHTGDRLPAGFNKWFNQGAVIDRLFPDGKPPAECLAVKGKPVLRVAQTPANAWGLFDMHGNAAEWCSDWYGPYEALDQADPLGRSDGDFRVMRGGSHSALTRLLRSANRSAWLPEAVSEKVGFRVALGEPVKGQLLPPPPAPLHMRNVGQSLAKIQALPADVPYFAGPRPYVKIPADSFGPLFSVHNHSPAIVQCANGDLLAVWYSCVDEGGTELCNLASRLRCGSDEWEPAAPFWDGPDVNDHAPKLWRAPDQTLYHFARGALENIVRTSTDNGAAWSKARIIQPVGELGNAPLRLRNGHVVIAHDSTHTSLVVSPDDGRNWSYLPVERGRPAPRPGGEGPRHAGIHSPIVELADRRLMSAGRYDKPEDQLRFQGFTPWSFSADEGRTWTYAAAEFPAISSVQRQVLIRLVEGPLLFCSFTDQWRDWKKRKGLMLTAADGRQSRCFGLFAAVSNDEGRTWPCRRLITPGGPEKNVAMIDRGMFTLSDAMAEPCGYLAACQTADGRVQLITSKNHYTFNLAWLKQGASAN